MAPGQMASTITGTSNASLYKNGSISLSLDGKEKHSIILVQSQSLATGISSN